MGKMSLSSIKSTRKKGSTRKKRSNRKKTKFLSTRSIKGKKRKTVKPRTSDSIQPKKGKKDQIGKNRIG